MEPLALAIPSQLNREEPPPESCSHPDTSEPSSAPVVDNPYIFSLDHDILLHIFHVNTLASETEYCTHDKTFTTHSPIDSTRYASQVCRTWRQILLGSPSIWGSLVDMSIIDSSSETWAEAVMKRTGESYLSIYGCVGSSPRSRAFLTSLLTDHWHRVRRLDIIMGDHLLISSETWDILFTRPAPALEKFIVKAPDNITRVFPLPTNIGRPMFANCAPALRRFHCSIVEVEYNTTWMFQLLSVTLTFPIDTTQVLGILRTTVRLESVVIDTSVSNPEEETSQKWSRPIALPHLRRLHIIGNASQALLYLQRIHSHQDCALLLEVEDDAANVSTDQIEQISSAVTPYTSRYFTIHKPRNLFVFVGHLTFDLANKVKTDMDYFAHPETRLGFHFMRRVHQPVILSLNPILSILSSSSLPLGSITELALLNSRVSWIDADDNNFMTFITSLTAVTKLTINQYTLPLINDIPLPTTLLFPGLQDVHLRAGSTIATNFPSQLLLFLGRRKAAGVPVGRLDLNGLVSALPNANATRGYNWTFLDEVDGLHVVWCHGSEEIEYLCGSGEGKHRLVWT